MTENTQTPTEASKSRFVEKLGIYYESYGVPRIGGRIIGLLLTAGGPISAEEIASELRVSRSSVSTNIRLLLAYGLAEVASKRGGRTDFFTISENAWENTTKARIAGFKTLKDIVEQGISVMGGDEVAFMKMREMKDWSDAMIRGHEAVLRDWSTRKSHALPEVDRIG